METVDPFSASNAATPDELRLSIVVVSLNATDVLQRCVERLAQVINDQIEVIIVRHWYDGAEHNSLRTDFPHFRWLRVPQDTTVPCMRSLGVRDSRGALVALLEDDCLIGPTWARRIMEAEERMDVAIGGPIEPDNYSRALDWGIFLCEYGRFMPPFSGSVSILAGNNVAYRRAHLIETLGERGLYDVFLHQEWIRAGHTLLADPMLAVININRWSYRHATLMPFHHGRAYGAMRISGKSVFNRLLCAAAALCLPLLQPLRRLREAFRARRHWHHFVRALPWVVLFYGSWAAGELLGSLFGVGTSADYWR